MTALLMLIPVALLLGLLGLGGFLWALKTGQFEDLDGAANRILFDDDDMMPPADQADPVDPAQQASKDTQNADGKGGHG